MLEAGRPRGHSGGEGVANREPDFSKALLPAPSSPASEAGPGIRERSEGVAEPGAGSQSDLAESLPIVDLASEGAGDDGGLRLLEPFQLPEWPGLSEVNDGLEGGGHTWDAVDGTQIPPTRELAGTGAGTAAAAPMPGGVVPTLRPAEVPGMVTRTAARTGAGDEVEVQLRLDPPSLGEVRLRLTATADGVRVQMVTQSREAAALLAEGQPRLREELARQGLSLHSFSASLDSRSGGGSDDGATGRRGDGATGRQDPGRGGAVGERMEQEDAWSRPLAPSPTRPLATLDARA